MIVILAFARSYLKMLKQLKIILKLISSLKNLNLGYGTVRTVMGVYIQGKLCIQL